MIMHHSACRCTRGRSLEDIAEAEGKSGDGLVDVLVEEQEAALAAAVDDGRITESQADGLRENLRERIEFFVERSPHPWGGRPGHPRFHPWR
jgi:hypothetical protein